MRIIQVCGEEFQEFDRVGEEEDGGLWASQQGRRGDVWSQPRAADIVVHGAYGGEHDLGAVLGVHALHQRD